MTQPFLTISRALADIPGLAELIGAPVVYRHRLTPASAMPDVSAVLAWGHKPSAQKAKACASRLGKPVLRLEDGFLRSVGLGKDEPPLSLVMDDLGIYYDATAPSRLERLVAEPLDDAEAVRARELIRLWRSARVSKYNHARERDYSTLSPYVLVIDQTAGDASIRLGMADAHSFRRMLEAALERYPEHQILLKVHPDVVAGYKQGHFSDLVKQGRDRVQLIAANVHGPALLERAEAVFCVTSQMGFEALLWGKPVHVFGMPFYAGWGLTNDALPAPSRRGLVSLEQLVCAALVKYPRYLDPETGERCEVERLLAWMALQRTQRERFSQQLFAARVPRWKKPVMRDFVQGSELTFVKTAREIPAQATRLVWGLAEADGPAMRLEDGFIRSVGLGADLVRPQSWVLDDVGMYYDATRPSRLERLLQEGEFSSDLLERAARLRKRLLAAGITKYNVGQRGWQRPAGVDNVILVPGQVESDASIRFGSPVIRNNLALLKMVREANPSAWIVYKPHPDVVAELRLRGEGESDAAQYADEVVTDQDMGHMLSQVDTVHTLTSLAGFEALIRGLPVTCYGQPFYAGWGLTQDLYPHPRRSRRVTLDELVAATLILYPTYLSQVTGKFTTVERVIEELQMLRRQQGDGPSLWQRLSRKLRLAWRF